MTVRIGGKPFRFQIIVECGHKLIFPSPAPELGDVLFCRFCDDYRAVRTISQPIST